MSSPNQHAARRPHASRRLFHKPVDEGSICRAEFVFRQRRSVAGCRLFIMSIRPKSGSVFSALHLQPYRHGETANVVCPSASETAERP